MQNDIEPPIWFTFVAAQNKKGAKEDKEVISDYEINIQGIRGVRDVKKRSKLWVLRKVHIMKFSH